MSFFNDKGNCVELKYIESSFIGHGDAETCPKIPIDTLGNLDYVNNLIQMGVDDPNVNWKLFDMMKQDRLEKNPKAPPMLELGSCGFYAVHGAFGTTESATDWNLAKFVRNCFSIFKMSRARRSDYLQANDLHDAHKRKDTSYLFPLKFCGHRLPENTKVISRIIDIFPYLQKYFQWLLTEKKIRKKDERFEFLKVYLADPILPAILQFALSVMEFLEPFLTLFQAERPLVFFMYENLKDLILSLVTRFDEQKS